VVECVDVIMWEEEDYGDGEEGEKRGERDFI
jgi:hypothetical protein